MYAWARKTKRSMGYKFDHTAPRVRCCGIYALTEPKPVLSKMGIGTNYYKGECVVGTVKLWGRMFEGPQGWQAEYAYPDELFVLHDDNPATAGDIAHDLEVAYGVEVAARPFSTPW